mmetsp:Transcript_7647/g.25905  ORF Transcript_7647/g.25905 Transcript_7647/m.25905 type:complete len:712 (-) Transcript_7647:1440-3575(-)
MDTHELVITPLGAGREVGRSCHHLRYGDRQILLDVGVHPGRSGTDGLPFFDLVELDAIDLVLVTHLHLDHCAALPYLTERTSFAGAVYMTHATKALLRSLLKDYVRVRNSDDEALYSEEDLDNCLAKCQVIDYHQTLSYKGMKFSCHAAGHVLGACMFMLDIDGVRVLYTGDYSTEEDRHLMAAQVPDQRPHLLVVESTFGVQVHAPREQREHIFTSVIADVVRGGGRCLLPVFATGRAQELLLVLDEFWQANPDLHEIPVFYASKLANRALRVYQTYINMMNEHIRALMDVGNPFKFSHVRAVSNSAVAPAALPPGPCVVMASPGMLQSGLSRHLFESWCDDEKNGVMLAGYAVEGTLAKDLLKQPVEVQCLDGSKKARKCRIESVSFAAHVDYNQNLGFIQGVNADHVVLVHGEAKQMERLHDRLWRALGKAPTDVSMPALGQPVIFRVPDKPLVASALGSCARAALAGEALPEPSLLVQEDFEARVVAADELGAYTPLVCGRVQQRVRLRCQGSPTALILLLRQVFDAVVAERHVGAGPNDTDVYEVRVQGLVVLRLSVSEAAAAGRGGGAGGAKAPLPEVAEVSWSAGPEADMVADCVMGTVTRAVLLPAALAAVARVAADEDVATVRRRRRHHHHHQLELQRIPWTRTSWSSRRLAPVGKWDALVTTCATATARSSWTLACIPAAAAQTGSRSSTSSSWTPLTWCS